MGETVIKVDNALIHGTAPAALARHDNTPAAANIPQAGQDRLDGPPAGRHFQRLEGVAAAPADPENMMTDIRLIAGRHAVAIYILAAGLFAAGGAGRAAEPFPFDQELLLDVRPMPPVKRVPVLVVAPNGAATIDLWCKTVKGRVELSDTAIRIEPGPLPDDLPQYMSTGQCTSERMQADEDTLAALAQVTEWRRQGGAVVLVGPTTLKFRPSDH
jgi:hypothetical protein